MQAHVDESKRSHADEAEKAAALQKQHGELASQLQAEQLKLQQAQATAQDLQSKIKVGHCAGKRNNVPTYIYGQRHTDIHRKVDSQHKQSSSSCNTQALVRTSSPRLR